MDSIIIIFLLLLNFFGVSYFARVLQRRNATLQNELDKYLPIKNIELELVKLQQEVHATEIAKRDIQEKLSKFEFDLDMHELGIYQPKFEFDDLVQYSEALDLVREAQKELVRQKVVIEQVDGSPATSKLRDIAKLGISAFNGEANSIIESVRWDNFEKSHQQIKVSFEKINSLIKDTGLRINQKYFDLKFKEMALVYDCREAERKEKEEQTELKAQMKEEEEARVESEKARGEAIKEEAKYTMALEQARKEIESKTGEERANYEAKLLELQKKLDEATAEKERATSMAQITKKGHIYVISNIGSFGENIFKVGMTRRNNPMDRIKELGDASVPFEFDIHGMIRTDDAPTLENALHAHFDSHRLNKVNPRKEFFKTTLEEITQACDKLGYKVKLTKIAEARSYRESLRLAEIRNIPSVTANQPATVLADKNSSNYLKNDSEEIHNNNQSSIVTHKPGTGEQIKPQHYPEAINSLKKAIHLDPNNAEMHYKLGQAYARLPCHQEATTEFQEAIRLDPNNGKAYFSLGLIYVNLQNYSDAITKFQETIHRNPKFGEAHFNLGYVYDKLLDGTNAIFHIKEAEKLYIEQNNSDKITKVRKNLKLLNDKYGHNV